jgi:2-methylcitrate dehydratase
LVGAEEAVERIAAFAAAARPERLTPDIRELGCAIAALPGPPFQALREELSFSATSFTKPQRSAP